VALITIASAISCGIRAYSHACKGHTIAMMNKAQATGAKTLVAR
jgi:hypothetical protein